MTNIKYDEHNIKNKKNNLSSARNSLFSAIYEVTCMSIPDNLYGEEANYLRRVRERLDGVVSSINQYDNWIDSSLYQVNDMFSNIHKDVTVISEIKLEERENSVLIK